MISVNSTLEDICNDKEQTKVTFCKLKGNNFPLILILIHHFDKKRK